MEGAFPPVLLVDWYNTLSTSKFWQQWAPPDHPMHHAFQTIQARWLGIDRPRIANWMRGQLTSEEINTSLAQHLGLDFNDLQAAFIQSCEEMRLDVPGVSLSVQKLRKAGVKVYIATDNMDSICRWTAPAQRLETVFDGILSSHQVGFLKEDLWARQEGGFFNLHLARLGIAPEQCLLIDDAERTCRAVGTLGMRTYRVSGPQQAAAFLEGIAGRCTTGNP